MKIRTVCNYREAGAKVIAYRIKNAADNFALQLAAKAMAAQIPMGAVLIPVPSSSGLSDSMTALAALISSLVPETVVIEAVRRRYPVQSSYLLRKSGKQGFLQDEHLDSMEVVAPIATACQVILVDNVVSSGSTLAAIEILLGRQTTAVVYSDARRNFKKSSPLAPFFRTSSEIDP